jgi:hypothetical protein
VRQYKRRAIAQASRFTANSVLNRDKDMFIQSLEDFEDLIALVEEEKEIVFLSEERVRLHRLSQGRNAALKRRLA